MGPLASNPSTQSYQVGSIWPQLHQFPQKIGVKLEATTSVGQNCLRDIHKYKKISKWTNGLHIELQNCLNDGAIVAVPTPEQFEAPGKQVVAVQEGGQEAHEHHGPSAGSDVSSVATKRAHSMMDGTLGSAVSNNVPKEIKLEQLR